MGKYMAWHVAVVAVVAVRVFETGVPNQAGLADGRTKDRNAWPANRGLAPSRSYTLEGIVTVTDISTKD